MSITFWGPGWLAPCLHVWCGPAGLSAPLSPRLCLLSPCSALSASLLLLLPRLLAPAGGGSPEPHLPPHAAVTADDRPGDVDSAPVTSLEGGGAGGGAGREVVKYAHMKIGMCGLEHVTGVFVMVGIGILVGEESVHWIHKWIVEWIIEWIMSMVCKESSKEVKWV